jgi:hypothetical protein
VAEVPISGDYWYFTAFGFIGPTQYDLKVEYQLADAGQPDFGALLPILATVPLVDTGSFAGIYKFIAGTLAGGYGTQVGGAVGQYARLSQIGGGLLGGSLGGTTGMEPPDSLDMRYVARKCRIHKPAIACVETADENYFAVQSSFVYPVGTAVSNNTPGLEIIPPAGIPNVTLEQAIYSVHKNYTLTAYFKGASAGSICVFP